MPIRIRLPPNGIAVELQQNQNKFFPNPNTGNLGQALPEIVVWNHASVTPNAFRASVREQMATAVVLPSN